ncbi:MAG: hypothetical protein ACKVTZ_19845 [Bacteroidia bacterium]
MAVIKSFEKWKTQEVENTFGVSQQKQMPLLEKWLAAHYDAPEMEKIMLNKLKDKLLDFIEFYNEADISMFFISHVLTIIDFVQEKYRAYNQLPLKQKLKDIQGKEIEVGGIVEMLVARGKQIPETPFFFLNEYKPEKRTGSESDPKGQLLIAMLAAQAKNQDEFPIYGCYVNGRNWHFVVLEGKSYAVSNAYNATDNDIFQIYSILMEVKRYIHLRLNLPF